jgi:selenocysteine lyase/cysteine desulfurase
MSVERRDFLRYSSLGVAAGLLATSPDEALGLLRTREGTHDLQDRSAARHVAGPSPRGAPTLQERPQVADWEAVRGRFAIDRSYVHMSGFYLASHPEPVAFMIREYRERLDANPTLELGTDGEALARQSIVRYCGAPPGEVALTTSTTMGLAIAIGGMRLGPSAEILHTTHDHRVMGASIQYKAEHSGATVRQISLYDDDTPESATEAQVLERLRLRLRPETRVFAATWVDSKNGVKLPIPAMSRVIDEANASRAPEERVVFIVDGVHGFGVEDVDVPALGCDFFAAGTHKWMFGPRGTGILWGNPRAHSRLTPIIPPMGGGNEWGAQMSPGGFQAFEHRWAMGRAFDFHREIGRARIQARVRELSSALKDALRGMRHVRVFTPNDPAVSAGMVCFEVQGVSANDVVARLLDDHRIIATTTPYTPSLARLAPGLLNDLADVEKCAQAVATMA